MNSNDYSRAIKLMQKISDDPHPSFIKAKQKTIVQNSHPPFFLNNLGVIHLRMKKFNLALAYFQKALKSIPSYGVSITNNTNELISANNTNLLPEIHFNMGLSLYFTNKYEDAFKCFEISSFFMRENPRVWFRMGMCCVKLYQSSLEENQSVHKSDVYTKVKGYNSFKKGEDSTKSNCKSIILHSKRHYLATNEAMSLFKGRMYSLQRYFENCIYAITINSKDILNFTGGTKTLNSEKGSPQYSQ